jgi:filamentous hemagglutinin
VENNSLLGDYVREKNQNSVNYWKDQVRETMGENALSQLTNGILNVAGDIIDLVAGGADTVLDGILALGSCTMGASYCDTAIKDLQKANKTVGDALLSLSNGDTWESIKHTFEKANQGDQDALEDMTGILAGMLIPVKKVPNGAGKVTNAGKGTNVKISPENQKYVDILSPEAKQHILYGDGPTSGGLMYPGNPGKTTFPKDWSADKIVHEIGDIATSPNTQWYAQSGTGGLYTKAGNPARWAAYEIRDGVRIRVIYEPANGKIITAFPDKAPVPSHYKPIK